MREVVAGARRQQEFDIAFAQPLPEDIVQQYKSGRYLAQFALLLGNKFVGVVEYTFVIVLSSEVVAP